MHFGFQGWRQRIDTFYSGNNGLAGTFTYSGRAAADARERFHAWYALEHRHRDSWRHLGTAREHLRRLLPGRLARRGNSPSTWGCATKYILRGRRYKNRETNFGLLSGAMEQPGQDGNSNALYNTYKASETGSRASASPGIAGWRQTGNSIGLHVVVLSGRDRHQSQTDHQPSLLVRTQRGLQ